ncbi:MAG: DUF167 domain-containing protein [Deltaproteobacteria bacterium]|nr:DUF167 domain-containing protein [Deltaproteobacteria bacterium]
MPRRLTVHVKPNARRVAVEMIDATTYRIAVPDAPHEGKANDAVLAVLAKHLGIAKSRMTIRRGHRSRIKVIEIA